MAHAVAVCGEGSHRIITEVLISAYLLQYLQLLRSVSTVRSIIR